MIDSQSAPSTSHLETQVEALEADLARARADLETLQAVRRQELQRWTILSKELGDQIARERTKGRAQSAELRATLDALYQSSSWRLTAPVRAGMTASRKALQQIRSLPRTLRHHGVAGLRIPVTWAAGFLSTRPKLRARATRTLRLYLPGVSDRLRQVYHSKAIGGPTVPLYQLQYGPQMLSPRARKAFDDIKTALQEADHPHRN